MKAKQKKKTKSKSKSWVRIRGGPVLACVDMGTNSFHMIVCQARPDHDGFEVITRVREAVPLIRSSLDAHYIDAEATKSAQHILRSMKYKAIQKGATTVIAVATSAVREAKNGEEFLAKIRDDLDIDARMISGQEEARLIYLGVLWSMPHILGSFGIVDIGGGSTEIIVGNRKRRVFSESYKLGAARLTQRFFRKKRPNKETIAALHDEVRGVLRPCAAKIAELGGVPKLVGTSGTIQALAKLNRKRQGKSRTEAKEQGLKLKDLEEIVAVIEKASSSGRKIEDVSSDRNQTILAGSIVALETMRSLGVNEMIVCDAALREGVVVDRFLQTGWLDLGLEQHKDPRSDSVHVLLEKYHASIDHAEQVTRIAADIFQQTDHLLHNYPEGVGHLLWSAAMLHDIGSFVGRNGHHKHSHYLIKNGGILGHSEEEINLIACIARYHRGSFPKDSHQTVLGVPQASRKLVADMASILRLAEALDRSHRCLVQDVTVLSEPTGKGKGEKKAVTVLLSVPRGENCEPEQWAFNEKKTLFEAQFNVYVNAKLHRV